MGPRRLELDTGRVVAYDDVGDPEGAAVVYLHGTPDCRLARHPDDTLAARAGVRLLAVDRPGFGGTSGPAGTARTTGADDVAALLDHLDLHDAALLGWSAGGLAALVTAWSLGDRINRVTLVATVPPVEAYADSAVLAALGPGRRGFVDMAAEVPAGELAAELAPYLVPRPLTPEAALEHVAESAGDIGRRELAEVPGALERLAAALEAGVVQGTSAVELDLCHQLEPGLELGEVTTPVLTVHGELDEVSPPPVGTWLAARLPRADVEVVPGAAHHLLFPHWERLLQMSLSGGGRR